MVGKPSPTMPFTSPAKRKMPETMSGSLVVPPLPDARGVAADVGLCRSTPSALQVSFAWKSRT